MARKHCRPQATMERELEPAQRACPRCGERLYAVYRTSRTITTLEGVCHLTVQVRWCRNPDCVRYRCSYRPEEEGRWAFPHGEFGLDVIALVGTLRSTSHRSIPEIHQALCDRGVQIAQRTVTHLLQRYEELVALRLSDQRRLRERFKEQGQVVLAIDGLQPDVGHEVLWVVRDCLITGKSFSLEACEVDLASLLREIPQMLDVPIRGVISDGQRSIEPRRSGGVAGRSASVVPLSRASREAAKPVYEADRHAKKELKRCIRGVRPIERAVEKRDDAEAEAIRGSCLAVRSALTDDGRAPLEAPGLTLHERLSAIAASLTRVSEEGACRVSENACSVS